MSTKFLIGCVLALGLVYGVVTWMQIEASLECRDLGGVMVRTPAYGDQCARIELIPMKQSKEAQ